MFLRFSFCAGRPFISVQRLLLCMALVFPSSLLGAESAAPQTPPDELQGPPVEQQTSPDTTPTPPANTTPATSIDTTPATSTDAAPATPATPGIPPTPKIDSFDFLQKMRNSMSGVITRAANSIDRFFAGDRHYQESNQTEFELSLSRATGYGGDRKLDLSANLNLKLPVSEGRLHLLLETDPERNAIDPTSGNSVLPNRVAVPKSAAVALRYETPKDQAWFFHTDGGLKFPLPVEPFVRTRGGYSSMVGKWQVTAAESVYWFNTLGVGETSQLDLERIFDPQYRLHSTSTVTWLKNTQNFDMRQDLSYFYTMNDRTVWLYQLSTFGISNPQRQVTDYVALVDYRYRMHRKWMYFEVSPQYHFPKDREYKPNFAFTMRLSAMFNDAR